MKKKIFSSVISLLIIGMALPVLAEENTANTTTGNLIQSNSSATTTANLKYNRRAVVVKGLVKEVKGTTVPADLVVTVSSAVPKKNKNWTGFYPETAKDVVAKIDTKTNIIRKYGGKSNLSEFTVGDRVQMVGKTNADGSLTVSLIRNESIHNTLLLKEGEITTIDVVNNTFVLRKDDKSLIVKVTNKTKLVISQIDFPQFSNLKVGDKVHVRGIINDRTNFLEASLVRVSPAEKTVKKEAVQDREVKKEVKEIKNKNK